MPDYQKKKEDNTPKDELLKEVSQHYEMWTQDNDKRMTRKNGWNDITDAYYGVLPDDWPYITKIVDPRIRTTLLEKNARLINGKLRGRLTPREGGDVLKAQLNNAILDYQWDNANDGGSMMIKLSVSDMDARMYATKFALVSWKQIIGEDGKIEFEGNEMTPLDIRNCGIDPNSTHIRDAKWFQHRSWEAIEDMQEKVDANGKKIFKNLDKVKRSINESKPKGGTRRNEWTSRVKQIRGLEDRLGEDMAFPVVEVVTEYRKDKWITFLPDYSEVVRVIDNPYEHGKIPVAQLRYYPIQDDPLGESEVEGVIPLWKAIQATVCSYMDEVILKMRPPLKIVENAARIETIQYSPEAQWLVDDQDAIQEMATRGDSLRFFQTTYTALVSAFNTAMGDLSQGISQLSPLDPEKTATEVRATVEQQNVRDQKNQNDLADFIKEIMMMWLANNQQFLFEPGKTEHIVRIVGQEQLNFFKRAGLDEMEVDPESQKMIDETLSAIPTEEITPELLENLYSAGSMPKFPVFENPSEQDPEKLRYKPKMRMGRMEDSAEVSIVPDDLDGVYDYIPDVKSMSAGQGEMMHQARQQAIQLFTSNPTVLQLLQGEGYKPNVKELIRSHLEETGLRDSERFFTKITEQGQTPQGVGQMAGPLSPGSQQGVQGVPQANPGVGIPEQMGGAVGLQAPQAIS